MVTISGGRKTVLSGLHPLDRIGGAGGLQGMRIEQTGDALMLSLAPWTTLIDAEQAAWGSEVENLPLLTGVESVTFRYQRSIAGRWLAEWRTLTQVVRAPFRLRSPSL